MAVPPAPVRVPSQRPLAPSVASVMSVTNDKGDNEMILGAVHSSPGICLTYEENPGKPQLGDRLMRRLCNQSSLVLPDLRALLGVPGFYESVSGYQKSLPGYIAWKLH